MYTWHDYLIFKLGALKIGAHVDGVLCLAAVVELGRKLPRQQEVSR